MSPSSSAPGLPRSAAVVNEDIRQLVTRAGGWLYGEDRAEYERLIEEWAAAVRAKIVEAA